MHFTAVFPMFEASHLVPLARVAEEAGFESIAVPDSVFYVEAPSEAYPYTADGSRFWDETTPFVDPFISVAAMAAVTERIRFYTNVVKLPLRHPLLVAKQVSSIAALSGDRFTLGVGLSWLREEFEWTHTEKRTRGARTDEAIEIIRKICSPSSWAEHSGKHYAFGRLTMSPPPGRPVPIWVGGHSRPALERAARLGDGWVSVNVTTLEIAEAIGTLRDLRGSLDDFAVSVFAVDAFDLDSYRRLADLGVTHAQAAPWYMHGGDPNALETRRDAMLRFADDVIAKL